MKNFNKILFVLAVITCTQFFLQGCKTVKNEKKQSQLKTSIDGKWTLKEFEGKKVTDLFKGTIPTLNFNSKEGLISGSSGCNTYSGSYSLDKDILSSPNLTTTLMLCTDENQEPKYLKMLSNPNKVTLSGDLLTLSNNGKVIATFEKVTTEQSIIGQWYLNSMPEEDLSLLFQTSENIPTITFNKDGEVVGNSGCNNYKAPYQIEDSKITIGQILSTRMACSNLEGENKFITRLSDTSTISFVNGELFFVKDGKTILSFKKR